MWLVLNWLRCLSAASIRREAQFQLQFDGEVAAGLLSVPQGCAFTVTVRYSGLTPADTSSSVVEIEVYMRVK